MHFNDATESYSKFSPFFLLPELKLEAEFNMERVCQMSYVASICKSD